MSLLLYLYTFHLFRFEVLAMMFFAPDATLESFIKISAPIATALISSGVTYLIFSRTMAANVRAKVNETQASFIASMQTRLNGCEAKLKECEDDREELWGKIEEQHRWRLFMAQAFMRFVSDSGLEMPAAILDKLREEKAQ